MPTWAIYGNERFRGPVFSATAAGGCSEASAFLSGAGAGLTGAYPGYYTTLICGLVTDGVWPLLDMLQIYATQDATNAVLDLKGGPSASGTATFTANLGYSLPTGAESLNTNLNLSTATQYQQDSASIGVWAVVCAAALDPLVQDSSSVISTIWPRYTADGKLYTRINDAGFDGPVLNDGTGFSLGVRTTSNDRQTYRNGGAAFTGTIASVAVTNVTLIAVANIPSAQVAACCAGGSLDSTKATALYNRLRAYMTSVGVP